MECCPRNRKYGNAAATLQLCVDRHCLIFHLLHAQTIPRALTDFLANGNYTFVGVGIKANAEKLLGEYDLKVTNAVELGPMAADKLRKMDLRRDSLKVLCREVLGKEMEKPHQVTRTRWDNVALTVFQVECACLDAFVSSEIGRRLTSMAVVS